MKKAMRFTALLLALVMALSLAACSGSSTEDVSDSTQTTDSTDDAASAQETEDDEESEDSQAWEGEISEINIYVMDIYGVSDSSYVQAAMNEITEASVGVTANITYVSTGEYDSKLSLAIAGGEQIDLAMITPLDSTSFTTMYANGQLLDITEYMEDEGAETLDMIGDYINAYVVDGCIYGVPAWRNYASSAYIIMRQDILEELGLLEFAQNMTTWSEFEEILAAVDENYDLAPIVGTQMIAYRSGVLFGSDVLTESYAFDALSDSLDLIYTDSEGNVSFLLENEDFLTAIERVRGWYDNGWVYEDSIITSESSDTLIKSGVAFSEVTVAEYGVEAAKAEDCGYEMVCVELCSLLVDSSSVNKFGFAIPVTAEEPEAAIRWLNALYTSEELCNLLMWGIEGEDYVVEDGEAVYPEGEDSSTVNYHTIDWLYGNFFLALPWDGSGSDYREETYAALMAAEVSPYLGFTVDQSEMTNVIAALTSVVTQYEAAINCGAYTDAYLEEYIAKLETAGLQDYIDAYQEQLTQWLQSN